MGAVAEQVEPLLVSAYEELKRRESSIPPAAAFRLKEAGERLVAFYEAWEKPKKAAEWRDKLRETKNPKNP